MKKLLIIILLLFTMTLSSCEPEPEEVDFKITYRGNGGTPISQVVYVRYGEAVEMDHLYVPERYGYILTGFFFTQYPNAQSKHCYYTGDIYDRREDTTCWAGWR